MMNYQKNSHCSYCGTPFNAQENWPRLCQFCQNTSFLNPIPVVVLLVPFENKILTIRRGIEPHQGKLALPGGFIENIESWQEAGSRELKEETGLFIPHHQIEEFWVQSSPNGMILIFGLTPNQSPKTLQTFQPSKEALDYVLLSKVEELAFPLHTEAIKVFFHREPSKLHKTPSS